jgi:predicted site-specific integrase-resolvase
VSYKTAWRWWQAGHLDAYRTASGASIVREAAKNASWPAATQQVAMYARISAAENRPNLESQAQRLAAYGAAKGYQVH